MRLPPPSAHSIFRLRPVLPPLRGGEVCPQPGPPAAPAVERVPLRSLFSPRFPLRVFFSPPAFFPPLSGRVREAQEPVFAADERRPGRQTTPVSKNAGDQGAANRPLVPVLLCKSIAKRPCAVSGSRASGLIPRSPWAGTGRRAAGPGSPRSASAHSRRSPVRPCAHGGSPRRPGRQRRTPCSEAATPR